MRATSTLDRDASAAALRLEGTSQPWYLGATPLATLPWLIRLRWMSAGVEVAAAAVAFAFPALDYPLRELAWLLLVTASGDVAAALWLSRRRALPRAVSAAGLGLEILLLAGLLELTGGPFNPFTIIFVAHVTLAGLTLGAAYASMLAVLAAAAVGVLLYWHTRETAAQHHELNDFPTHLLTAWVAFTTTAELAAYFVVQASHALARRERQIEEMRQREARTERIMSLATLTAGAAHELSTPLATIALAARELEHGLESRTPAADLAGDARLIRTEVDRCRAILDQMSGRAGGVSAGDPEPIDLSALVEDVRGRLSQAEAARLQVRLPSSGGRPLMLPRAGLAQALLSLVRNAFDASTDGSDSPVLVEFARREHTLHVAVRDRGEGMPPDVLQRAGEPFFTTKEAGRGFGLGLFLARVFAERLGGMLSIESRDGTVVTLELPDASGPGRS
jgi:two-component system sensor histidine kinase RegB